MPKSPRLIILFCLLRFAVHVSAQTTLPCEVVADSKNGSRLCVQFMIKDGRVAIDRERSVFKPSTVFIQRLSIPSTEAETTIFTELEKLLAPIPRPYRFALSDQDKALDDQGKLNDEPTNRIRAATMPWSEYLQKFEDWSSATGKERGVGDIFPEAEA